MSRRTSKHHLYQVWLKVEDREDIDFSWDVSYKLLFETNTLQKAMEYIYAHRYLETEMDLNDDGEHWLHIQTLFYKRIR